MNERNGEIKKFVEKYSDILKASKLDVAHSEFEDRWFIFKYNPVFTPSYEFFIEINNMEQLANCILSELKFDMYSELEVEGLAMPECEKNDISGIIG